MLNIAMLLESVAVWNETRKVHPDFLIGLSENNLRWRDLKGADLSNVNLNNTDLSSSLSDLKSIITL